MRKRILLTFLVGIMFLIVWWLLLQRPAAPTLEASFPVKVAAKDAGQVATPAATPVAVSSTTRTQPSPLEVQEQRFVAAFNTPITFYGRVIDQHGAPVEQAKVKLSANDKAFGGRPSQYEQITDADGRFSIDNIHGITLAVAVSKPGYRGIPSNENTSSSSGLFEYNVSAASVRAAHGPEKNEPVVFVLHKPGPMEPLTWIQDRSFRMARDGSPLSVSLDQQGGHQVVLRCWNTDLQRPSGQYKYDWRLEVSVPGGGLVVREDAFAFQAPEGGYIVADIIDKPASLQRWSSEAELSYFIHFEDGTFARANLRMQAGGDHFVMWESFFNPKTGSRNLESDPTKETLGR